LERREKKIQRESAASENALTARQKLGVAISKLTQKDWDTKVTQARPTELVRFLDQAFGRPQDAEPDEPQDDALTALTREQRAVVMQALEQGDDPSDELAVMSATQKGQTPIDPSTP
jgi:hypothetical protein